MSKLCVYPWMHIHLHPTGRVLPCCMMDAKVNRDTFANINNDDMDLLSAMNSEGMKALRKQMLADQEPELCQICFDRERANLSSMRLGMNEIYYEKFKDDIKDTNEDGSISRFNPSYIDLRFSNLCNLKCRTCSVDLSSTWYEETLDLIKIQNKSTDPGSIQKYVRADQLDKIKPFLNTVDRMYWAGGEPLMEKNHYAVLDHVIAEGKAKNIQLSYNTNMTTITYKRKNIVEWWKEFEHITIAASIDGYGDIFNYIRTNGDWEVAKNNFEFLKFNTGYDHIRIYPSITVSILNIYHLVDFMTWCAENRWYDTTDYIHLNYVTYPSGYSIKNLPPFMKDELAEMMRGAVKKFRGTEYNNMSVAFEDCINIMYTERKDQTNWKSEMAYAIKMLDAHDKSARLDWKTTLPQLVTGFRRNKLL